MGSRVGTTPFPQLYPAAAEGGACGVAMVTIYVIGVDHLPTLQTLSAIISFGESYTFRPFDDSAVPDLTSPGMYCIVTRVQPSLIVMIYRAMRLSR